MEHYRLPALCYLFFAIGFIKMSNIPNISAAQVDSAIPSVSESKEIGRGGQKIVFRCKIENADYAIKFISCPEELESQSDDIEGEGENDFEPEVITRAKREIDTMHDCTSDHMVKLGPIGLEFIEIDGQNLAYYTEELIEGCDLKVILDRKEKLSAEEITRLGIDICDAIESLWELGKVHRDIKPGNIMQRASGGYVLLDAGLAFDVAGESLSGGFTVGTQIYFSPEQFNYSSRRSGLDFRSDMFALGVTLYQMATGRHPFYSRGDTSQTFFDKVTNESPEPITSLEEDFPEDLEKIILRMLGKSPHLRYRKCSLLMKELEKVGGV